jgi:hypothetical protein
VIDKHGGVQAAVRIMKSHKNLPKIQHCTCKFIGNFDLLTYTSVDLSVCIETASGFIRNHTLVEELVMTAFEIFVRLYENDDYLTLMGKNDGIKMMVKAMEHHRKVARIQGMACLLLTCICETGEKRSKFQDSGGVKAISRAILDHGDRIFTFLPVVKAFGYLGATQPPSSESLDGIKALLLCVSKHHMSDTTGVVYALSALIYFAPIKEYAQCIVENNGVEIIIQGMRTHKADETVDMNGCVLFGRLCQAFVASVTREIVQGGGVKAVIDAMNAHTDSDDMFLWGSIVFMYTHGLEESYIDMIVQQGGIQVLVYAIKNHGHEDRVVYNACMSLWYMCQLDVSREMVLKHGGIEAVLSAMSSHAEFEDIVEVSCCAFRDMAAAPEYRQALAEREVTQAVIGCLDKYKDANLKILEDACTVLAFLAETEVGRNVIFGLDGALTTLMYIMIKHCSDPGIVLGVIKLLRDVSTTEMPLLEIIAQHGAVEAVILAMNSHKEIRCIQQHGCELLVRFSYSPTYPAVIQRHGGIPALVAAFRTHGACEEGSRNVLGHASIAFRNLSRTEDHLEQLGQQGAIECVLLVMEKMLDDVKVLANACEMLMNVSKLPANKKSIRQQGGIQHVLRMMRTHHDVVTMQRYACQTLRHIVGNGVGEDTYMCMQAVLHAMGAHDTDESVVGYSLELLHNVCSHHSGSRGEKRTVFIAQNGGLEVLMRIMSNLRTSEPVIGRACSLLGCLAQHDHTQAALLQCGCIQTILTVVEHHKNSVLLQKCYLKMLLHMCDHEASVVTLVLCGGVRTVVCGMSVAISDRDTQMYGCSTLLKMCGDVNGSGDRREQVVQEGGVQAVLLALKSHVQEYEVVMNGWNLLHALCPHDDSDTDTNMAREKFSTVIYVMNAHKSSLTAQLGGCDLLLKWWGNQSESIKVILLDCGAVDTLQDAVDTHKYDVELKSRALSLLARLKRT